MLSKKKRMQSLTTSLQNSRTLELSTDVLVRMLQRKLYLKAKQSKTFKFYVLYDKVEEAGLAPFFSNIKEELINKTYKAQAVWRVYIPKANGKLRPLGNPTIKDRVVQMSTKMVIEPIFEADFTGSSFGFRPKKSAKDAMARIKEHLKEERTAVYYADLEAYFDTIPHDKLMKAGEQRIADKNVLALINQWLKCTIIDDEAKKTLGGKNNQRGTPQGGVISPLLSNIYLNLIDRIIENPMSVFGKEGVKKVKYADDFLLFSKFPSFRAYTCFENILTRMGLHPNKEKTSTKNARVATLDFLRFSVRDSRPPYKGALNLFWNIFPSKKAEQKRRKSIKETLRTSLHLRPKVYVKRLNVLLRGWVNYFQIKGVSYMYDPISRVAGYLGETLYRMIRRKNQNGWSKRYRQFAYKIKNMD